jgi:hypothetical protein
MTLSHEEARAVTPYLELIDKFVGREIDAPHFEDAFLSAYKADGFSWSDDTFDVLDELFADVDAFVADNDLRDHRDLDASGLLQAARQAAQRLRALIS